MSDFTISSVHRRFLIAALVIAAASVVAGASKQRVVRPIAHPNGPTFNKEVVRVFQDHCQSCHHPGDIAPFSLMDYAGAKLYATQIKVMTQSHQMPPWKPTPGCGDFSGTRGLSADELDTIKRWVEGGAPEGNAADLPAPLDFSSGWTLGQPDLVLSYPETFTPAASGDTYRCLPLPTNLTSSQYVSAIDVHPGDRKTVHHVIAFIDKGGESARMDAAEAGPGYTCFGGPNFNITDPGAATLGGWAPGQVAARLPEQVAFSLPAASSVVLQVHYHPHDGQPQADKTEIGIYFAKKKPQQQLYILPLINDQFTIPPGDSNYRVTAPANDKPLITPLGIHLWAIYPHMHLLGRKMNVTAETSAGSQCLINIDDWDFNWQGMYLYNSPVAIPGGAKLLTTAFYDNSSDNLRNPNYPPKAVSWGEQTTDEMCISFLAFTIDGSTASSTPNSKADTSWVPTWR